MEVKGTDLTILDNIHHSIGFPDQDWEKLITRDNYLAPIEDYLSRDTKVVFIEGEEDSGKTTLCAQFVKRHVKNSISIFFNPLNALDYTIEFFCLNVIPQIENLIGLDEGIDREKGVFNIDRYQQAIFQLRKKYKSKQTRIFLVIDGLEDKVKEDSDFVRRLLAILPFGQDIFKIIVSGNALDFLALNQKLKRDDVKPIIVQGFSEPEIIKYLRIADATVGDMRDLFKITKGFPGRLKTLDRLLKSKEYSLDSISSTTTYKHWLELDCGHVNLENSQMNRVMSLLALSDKSFSFEEIGNILSLDEVSAHDLITNVKILENVGRSVSFVSGAHKKYFASALRQNKKMVEDMLINFYSKSDSIMSLIELPQLLANGKEWGKIIEVLDEKYLPRILENTGSLKVVNEGLRLGVRASEQLNKYPMMWKYSIESSIINELGNILFWESEVEARVSIQDFAGAIQLAESAVLRVDRMKLLALVARRQKELKRNVDEELVKLIKELYDSTDLQSFGAKLYDIVADLIYAIPNLAIEMIEKSSGKVDERDINDWIVAKLSIAAINSSSNGEGDGSSEKTNLAIQQINNPSVKKINRAISFLVGNYSSQKVLEEVRKLSDSSEKIRLLRLWLNNNRSNVKDIEKVIGTALDELIAATSKSLITIDILKDLSYQLPYVRDLSVRSSLYKRFRSIDKDLSDLGVTKNRYIYELNMFQTEYSLRDKSSTRSINLIINSINDIDDLLIRLDCYGEVFAKLTILRDKELEKTMDFAYSRILILCKELFDSTADHYKVSKALIRTIGRRSPRLGLKISEQMNTISRRDSSRLLLLDSYLGNGLKHVSLDILKEIEESLEQSASRPELWTKVLERYAEAKGLHYQIIKELHHFASKIELITDPIDRTKAYVTYYRIVAKDATWTGKLSDSIEKSIYASWQRIESEWERIDSGFRICSSLSRFNYTFSRQLFEESEKLKNDSWLDSYPVAYTYLNGLKLIVKAYIGLVIVTADEETDFRIVEDLVARVPSEIEKLRIWTELGFSAYIAKSDKVVKKVLDDHVLPIIHNLVTKKIGSEQVISSLVLVYLYNGELAQDYLKQIDSELKEDALDDVCNFFITKQSPFEYYDDKANKYLTSFSDLTKAINVLGLMTTDVNIYNQIENICEAIKTSKDELHSTQVTTLVNKLLELIEVKFPDTKNIKHDGFKVLAKLKLAKIRKDLNHKTFWLSMVEECDAIPNASDRIFVRSHLLKEMPFERIPGGQGLKAQLYEQINNELVQLKIHYEFITRVIDVSDTMYSVNKVKWKEVVSKAFSFSSDLEDRLEVYNAKKKIIDSMYRLEPEFARDLVRLLDKENNNEKINSLLKDHFETLLLTSRIKNSEVIEDIEKENYRRIVRSIHQAQQALNSDRITTKKVSEVSRYLIVGNKLPLHEAFPVYSYYLTNCIKTYGSKKIEQSIRDLHRDNFKEVVNASNLIQLLSHRRKTSERLSRKFFIDEDFITNQLLKPKSREEAFAFIKSWIEDEVEEYIIVADPFFGKEDIEILRIIKQSNADIEIDILGSKMEANMNVEQDFKDHWRKISDEEPPFTNFTFCWTTGEGSQTPFHDRWMITKNGGMRLGTSINSMGMNKDSELSIMKPNEALKIQESTLKEYINRSKREHNGQRVSYRSFTL